MAEEYELPIDHLGKIKKDIKKLKNGQEESSTELLKTIIKNNMQIISSLNELVSLMRSASESVEENDSTKKITEKLDKISEQNYKILEALNELTGKTKKPMPAPPIPKMPTVPAEVPRQPTLRSVPVYYKRTK